ncbi:MAG: hypothetical protein IPJ81_11335 [Chitinophagaceae bacterium]|nr:hypothetical protein [Chitinophagaceae bacterium]
MNTKKAIIKKWLATALWISVGMGTITLLVAAIIKKDAQQCKGVDIEIKDINNNFFVDKKDVLNIISRITNNNINGMQIGAFDLRKIENELEKNVWIKSAELYFDNNALLNVLITERQPVARVYTTGGETFYLDSALARLPLSAKFSARIPVFTGFPSDKIVLSKNDSFLLKDISIISNAIYKDSFRMAMIEQIDITLARTFEMIPKIGNQIIVLGDATDIEEKFDKLKLFYEGVLPKAGLNKYSVINLQYKSQIVAKRKDAEDVAADAARTVQIMQIIAANAAREAAEGVQAIVQDNDNNSADSTIIEQSIQREEESIDEAAAKPVVIIKKDSITKPVVTKTPVIVKPIPAKPTNTNSNKKITDKKL